MKSKFQIDLELVTAVGCILNMLASLLSAPHTEFPLKNVLHILSITKVFSLCVNLEKTVHGFWISPNFIITKSLHHHGSISCCPPNKNCIAYALGKLWKFPLLPTRSINSSPAELVFSDPWNSPLSSLQENRYLAIFVDEFSSLTWLFPLVCNIFLQLQVIVEHNLIVK